MCDAAKGTSTVARAAPRSLAAYVAGGLVLGVAYAAANTMFDVLDRKTTLVATLALVHSFVDRGIPLLAGALIGVAVHYWRLRSAIAEREQRRADELGHRLEHVERDQAVWLVATATLHEVKNPLHSLGLLLDELDEVLVDGTAAEGAFAPRELMTRARTQIGRIDASIRGLRQVASTVEPTLGPVALEAVVRDITLDATSLGNHPSIELALETDLFARADRAYVRIILENLVQNGIEATAEAADPRVFVSAERSAGGAVVRVHDNGPGIPEGVRGGLFQPLSTSKTRGMGLGLSVSRALARAMHGDVVVAEVPGWATCLELRLPV